MDSLPNHTFRFGRGLNLVDAPEEMAEGQARIFQNFRLTGLGRATVRKAARQLSSTTGVSWLALVPYTAVSTYAGIAVGWVSATQVVALYKVAETGAVTSIGNLSGYTGHASAPTVHVAVVNGVVFVVDEGRSKGLTIWDPNNRLGAGADFFQPTFDFDLSGAGHAVALFNLVLEHRNHLFGFGYGDETDADHPEFMRFSYLNLVDDGHGSGDVGTGSAETRSLNLFDNEDVRTFVPKGERIVLASSAPDRLMLRTEREAWVIHGSDYETWSGDKIDSERGAVNSKAGGEANGEFYCWSRLGPDRYRGGGSLEDMTEMDGWGSIRPLIEEMDLTSLFFWHQVERHTVWWEFRRKDDTTAGCDRRVGVNYREGAWLLDVHPSYRVTCGGYLRPSGLESPAGAPSSLAFSQVTVRSALATWTPGDLAIGVRTNVYRAPDNAGSAGTYVLIATLEGAASQAPITNLDPSTRYWIKVEHVRNGTASAAVEDDFTTDASGVTEPANLAVENRTYTYRSGDTWKVGPLPTLFWDIVQTGVTVHIERKTGVGGTYAEIAETYVDAATWVDYPDAVVGTTYYYRVRAEDANGDLSSYSNEVNITVAATAYAGDPVASQVVVT